MSTLKDLFHKVGLTGLKINAGFATLDFDLKDADKDAAWDMYVELITRTVTQRLEGGHERSALRSIFSIFEITREIIKKNGRNCVEFTKVAVIVLNQVLRPFATKWHALEDELETNKEAFRAELAQLQQNIRKYTSLLAEMAGVEDITDLEKLN